jgi:hypothetical protein
LSGASNRSWLRCLSALQSGRGQVGAVAGRLRATSVRAALEGPGLASVGFGAGTPSRGAALVHKLGEVLRLKTGGGVVEQFAAGDSTRRLHLGSLRSLSVRLAGAAPELNSVRRFSASRQRENLAGHSLPSTHLSALFSGTMHDQHRGATQ